MWELDETNVVLSCRVPACDFGWVCDDLFQSVGAERSEGYGGSSVKTAYRPEWRHVSLIIYKNSDVK